MTDWPILAILRSHAQTVTMIIIAGHADEQISAGRSSMIK
jgi:hypothetical protein